MIQTFHPDNILKRGFAILRRKVDIETGDEIEIETQDQLINATVKNIKTK